MGLEENKAVACDFFDAMMAGDVARMGKLMTDDATWWVMRSTVFSGLHQKQEFLAMVPQLFAEVTGPFKIRFDEITAEDDRVSMTAKGRVEMTLASVFQRLPLSFLYPRWQSGTREGIHGHGSSG